MLKRRIGISAPLLSFVVCAIFLALYNFSFWKQAYSIAAWPFLIAAGILISALIFAVLSLFSFKYTYKPLLLIAFLMAAISAYSMDNYGYVVSTEAFRNVVETDTNEAFDLIHWLLIRDLAIFFVLPTLIVLYFKIEYPKFKLRVLHIVLSLVLCAANIVLFGKHYATILRNHKQIRYYVNPIRPLYSMVKYTVLKFKPGVDKQFIELDANPKRIANLSKPKLVVLVLGESDRALNHSINGYHRPTNPYLSKRSDIFSFSNFHSCGTETTVSVPCMFSSFRREDYNDHKGEYTENVLDLLQKSHVQVLWRDNDGGCKNVCNRVETHDLNEATIAPYCNGSECHDEVLLHNLQTYISADIKDKLIVLHKKGNHGPAYYKRYPQNFAQFAPICNTNELHKCSNEQLINTYDNIVLYTDFFLDTLIKQLESNNDKYQVALIYVSDHGESLGENGVYLHAMPYWLAPKEQTHVPFMFWASADFDVNREHLLATQHAERSHDHLFHSLLGLFDVQTAVYEPKLDLFSAG